MFFVVKDNAGPPVMGAEVDDLGYVNRHGLSRKVCYTSLRTAFLELKSGIAHLCVC